MKKRKSNNKKNNLMPRPPVVVVLGHVDHGKTSLLDYVRKANVAEKESGGITQHIGAYEVENDGKKITFIDTPGHEAFSAMRRRGGEVADVAVLVVAADEGVKEQTKEVIKLIKKIGISSVVAINKADKPEAQPEKVKNELSENDFALEERGGKIPSILVSAKTGQGTKELLEMISLLGDLEELKGNPGKSAQGVVIESYLDARRGPVATLLIKEGTLKINDYLAAGTVSGRARKIENFRGEVVEEASLSKPVSVIGFTEVPGVGENFSAFKKAEEAEKAFKKNLTLRPKKAEPKKTPATKDKKPFNLILKADTRGTLEAVAASIKAIQSEDIEIELIKQEPGAINESDIKLASATEAVVLGFRVKANSQIQEFALRHKIKISSYNVIYELIEDLRKEITLLREAESSRKVLGDLKVLAIFRTEKERMIVGGRVIKGEIKKNASASVKREDALITQGKIIGLQENKKEVETVTSGKECGILFKGEPKIEKGDILEVYEEARSRPH